jgi:hypothetical protein
MAKKSFSQRVLSFVVTPIPQWIAALLIPFCARQGAFLSWAAKGYLYVSFNSDALYLSIAASIMIAVFGYAFPRGIHWINWASLVGLFYIFYSCAQMPLKS